MSLRESALAYSTPQEMSPHAEGCLPVFLDQGLIENGCGRFDVALRGSPQPDLRSAVSVDGRTLI